MQTADNPKKQNVANPITMFPSDRTPRLSKIKIKIQTIETLNASWKRIFPSCVLEIPDNLWRTTPLK